MTTKTQENTARKLEQAIEDFERDNPQIMQTMQLFGITMSAYQKALVAMFPQHTVISSSTAISIKDTLGYDTVG